MTSDSKLAAVTLPFKDWARLVGALTGMVDMLDPEGTLVPDVRRLCAEIREQYTSAVFEILVKEAANEDAN